MIYLSVRCFFFFFLIHLTNDLVSFSWLTEFLPGRASLPLDLSKRIPNGQHKLSIAPGHGLAPTAIVTLEVRAT